MDNLTNTGTDHIRVLNSATVVRADTQHLMVKLDMISAKIDLVIDGFEYVVVDRMTIFKRCSAISWHFQG